MNDIYLQLAIQQAVRDGLGLFLDKTGIILFGKGPPQMLGTSDVPLSSEQPAMHAGPNNSLFYVLMNDSTRSMWRKACQK